MNPVSRDIKDFLEESAISAGEFAATEGWSIAIANMPDSPDTIILITDTPPGNSPEVNYNYEYPDFQIIVRGNQGGYLEAYKKAVEVRDGLHGKTNETINGARYIQILCTADIFFISFDEKKRPQFSINFGAHRTSLS